MTHAPIPEERRIIGTKSVDPRSAAARPSAFPAGQLEAGELEAGELEAGELEAFGLRALNSIGVRLAQIFLITALIGVALAASANQAAQALVAGLAVAVCAAGVAYVLPRPRGGPWLIVLVALTAVTVSLLASAAPGLSWDRTHQLAAWVVAGMAGGTAASRGPGWGLAVFIPAVAAELAVEHVRGGPVSALVFLGSLTYYIGAAVTHVLARRGFATTEQALEAVAVAEAAQRVAEERWQARREADRLLHDTVLATLSVLAHQGEGAAPGELQAACRRDLDILNLGRPETGRPASPRPGASSVMDAGAAASSLIEAARGEAAVRGLELRAYAAALEQPGVQLDPAVAAACGQALVECVANVRHAGVRHLDLMASVTADALVLVVVDEGRGFDQARIPADRLGLRASVQERLAAVGGSATIWTQPGQGTSVMLRVPRLAVPS
jgi:signal transduction histidine kinase